MAGGSAGPADSTGSCGFDPSRPNAARVYDYLLGGKDNFAADRDAADRLVEALPDAAKVAKANREFLANAVRYVASRGVGQFVDIGAGLPTSPNVHECAREAVPDARVAYVDNDPLVVTHARALLATDDKVTVVNGDAREYEAILSAPELAALIDPAEPVCVLFVSMLHFLPADEADAAVAAFREWMAPGSYLVISAGHGNDRSNPVRGQIQAAYGCRHRAHRPHGGRVRRLLRRLRPDAARHSPGHRMAGRDDRYAATGAAAGASARGGRDAGRHRPQALLTGIRQQVIVLVALVG